MSSNFKTEQIRRRHLESRPQHFCQGCSALRLEDDRLCRDCDAEQPDDGWTRLEDAFDPFLGRLLDERYLITKIEGRGGSSTIYRAESVTVPQRFAVKMVKLWPGDKHATDEVRARLAREVRAVGMLRNPHIVRVYEVLEIDQDWMALVIDHVDGQTLEECVEASGPLALDRACALVRQVANGLCEAHDVGMIHRDIKPANIMLEQMPDGGDFAYLLDFGVVHLEGEAKMTHGFLGTPLFASPEQATAATIDRRSDIYNLGATFFYMLTGRAPFESERTLEVLEAHVRKTPPTLATACPERSFPPLVESLVAKMLAKRPQQRPESLYEVIEALERLQESASDDIAPEASALEPGAAIHRSPRDSADFTNQLAARDSCDGAYGLQDGRLQDARLHGGGSTLAFHDRPKTMRGVRHAVEIVGVPSQFDSEEFERRGWRSRRDSSELTSFRQTNTGGFSRPETSPKQDQPASPPHNEASKSQASKSQASRREASRSEVGIAFARNVRQSGASSEKLIAFVDTHNEVWTVGDDELIPVATPLSRVCSVSASEEGAFVGLADGSISRVLDDRQGLEALFRDDHGRAITALASTRDGKSLLAGTAEGTLYLGQINSGQINSGQINSGRFDRDDEPWMALHANRGIAAVAMTPRGDVFAAASIDGFVRVATTDTPGTAIAKLAAGGHVCDLAFCNNGHLMAVLLENGQIPVFQVLDGRQISVLEPTCPTPQSVYFSRENILYGVCTSGGRIARWNLTTGRAARDE